MLGHSPVPVILWYSSLPKRVIDAEGTMKGGKRSTILCGAAALVILWSCQGSRNRVEPVTVDELAAHIRYLSDDQLEGRAVGTKGIELEIGRAHV